MAVAALAHRVLKIVSPDEGCPVHAGELRALVRMDQHPLLRSAPPHRHVKCLEHHTGGLPALHRPAHHGADVDDVCHLSQRALKLADLDILARIARRTFAS